MGGARRVRHLLPIGFPAFAAIALIFAAPPGSAFGGALPKTDDLLTGLPKAMRDRILDGADARRICKIRVLEKEMGLTFQSGSPTSEVEAVGGARPCDADAPTGVVNIADADELIEDEGVDRLVDAKARSKWFGTPVAYCRFKAVWSKGLWRASRKLVADDGSENAPFGLTDEADRAANRACYFGGDAAARWTIGRDAAYCATSKGSSAAALRCFYTEECRVGCGPGAVSLQMLGAYETFAGGDGNMSETEEERFDRLFPEITIGEFHGDGSPNGIEASASEFEGREIRQGRKYKAARLASYASKGRHGPSGLRVVVETKRAYQAKKRQRDMDFRQWVNFSENAVVLSTSSAGAQQLTGMNTEGNAFAEGTVGQFETDMKAMGAALEKLNYLSDQEGSIENVRNWQAWDQVTSRRNQAAIAAGTFQFYNLQGDDRRHLDTILGILNKPAYRDTIVHVHPLGRLTLAQVAIQILKIHTDAPVTLWSAASAEHRMQAKYVDSRMDACLAKQAAAATAR